MVERTFDDFDGHAVDYRKVHSENVKLTGADSYYFAEHKVIELTKNEKNVDLKMLDLGCGDGAIEIFVQKYFSKWKVEGVDISEKSIAIADERNIATAHFQSYDGIHTAFANSSFDIVFISMVLHHVDFSMHNKIMEEVFRVLKPGGRLYVFEHNPLNPFTRHIVKTCSFDKDAHLLNYYYAAKILSTVPFTFIKSKFILFFPRKGVLSKLVFLEDKLGWLPLGAQYYFRCVK